VPVLWLNPVVPEATVACSCHRSTLQRRREEVPPPSHKYGYRNPGLAEIYLHFCELVSIIMCRSRYLHWDQARNAWVEYRRQEALRKMSNISSAAEVATEFSTAQAYSSTS
jgi:hypothetical protein